MSLFYFEKKNYRNELFILLECLINEFLNEAIEVEERYHNKELDRRNEGNIKYVTNDK